MATECTLPEMASCGGIIMESAIAVCLPTCAITQQFIGHFEGTPVTESAEAGVGATSSTVASAATMPSQWRWTDTCLTRWHDARPPFCMQASASSGNTSEKTSAKAIEMEITRRITNANYTLSLYQKQEFSHVRLRNGRLLNLIRPTKTNPLSRRLLNGAGSLGSGRRKTAALVQIPPFSFLL